MRQPIDIDYVPKAIVGIASPVVGVMSLVSMFKKLRRR
jgi:hypothetical protein